MPRITGKFDLRIQNEARQRLTEFCQKNMLAIANQFPMTQKMTLHMDITRWSTPKHNQIDYVLCSQRRRSSKLSPKTRPELTVAQIISSLLQNLGLHWRK